MTKAKLLFFLLFSIQPYLHSQPINSDLVDINELDLRYKPQLGVSKSFKLVRKNNYYSKGKHTQMEYSEEIMEWFTFKITPVLINDDGSIINNFYIDSISVYFEKLEDGKFTSESYNSHLKNDIFYADDYFGYSSITEKQFSYRISPNGKILDIFSLDDIVNYYTTVVKKEYPEDEILEIKNSLIEFLKPIVNSVYITGSENPVQMNKPWEVINNHDLNSYPCEVRYLYVPVKVVEDNNSIFVEVEGKINIEFSIKEIDDDLKIEMLNQNGSNFTKLDLSEGFPERKNSKIHVEYLIKSIDEEVGAQVYRNLEWDYSLEEL